MNDYLPNRIVEIFSEQSNETTLSALRRATEAEWRQVLPWLDASGLALYLLHRLSSLNATASLPPQILHRLEHNLEDNRNRASTALTELARLQELLSTRKIDSLVLKGTSLIPHACCDAALRLQLDTDLLISSDKLMPAQEVLGELGYVVTAFGSDTWEFKTAFSELPALKDLYRPKRQRTVELHFVPRQRFEPLFQQRDTRSLDGIQFASLSATEGFLRQATHLSKHIRSEWTRLSWLLEFRNSIRSFRKDALFWQIVAEHLPHDDALREAIGIATYSTANIFGCSDLPSPLLTAVESLSPRMRLWVDIFGRSAALSAFPGSKLYLFQPRDSSTAKQDRFRKLIPLRTPPAVVLGPMDSDGDNRFSAMRSQFSFLCFRLAFHIREGIRFLSVAPRWRRLAAQIEPMPVTISTSLSTRNN